MARRLKRRQPEGPMWRSRIVGHGDERPDQLLANPFNWRGHTVEQQNLVEELLERVGWVKGVIVNRRTGHLLDGHLRVELAMRRDEETVPVGYVDVSEAEERLILASLDPSGELAFSHRDILDALVADMPDDYRALTEVLRQERRAARKTVTFQAAAETFRVVVECGDARRQGELLRRLTEEGWDCHAG